MNKQKFVKIRKLDRTISDHLKALYKYKCQICGEDHGIKYNIHLTEAHHIEPFSQSVNNNASNIMIICPNHHEIIHSAPPFFDRSTLTFIYPNGLRERLILNIHL